MRGFIKINSINIQKNLDQLNELIKFSGEREAVKEGMKEQDKVD